MVGQEKVYQLNEGTGHRWSRLGGIVTEELLNSGQEVCVYDSLYPGHRAAVDLQLEFQDLRKIVESSGKWLSKHSHRYRD